MTSGQRSVRFLGQDNPLAAQSELAHFAGRNAGGWAGGTAAAYALGSSGAGPMVLIAADAYFMSVAGEKAAALLDNRAIYHQTDRDGTAWSFDGRAWSRGGMADTTGDGIDNPAAMPIVASYAKSRELNYHATNAAAALALKDAPAPTDPYRQPANAGDRPSLNAADWRRDTADGQWHRLVKTEISGANDRGGYEQETASPPRAAELDAQAQAVIAHNIANSPGAIAARYELTYHRSGWAAEGLPMSPAVQQALPDPDALIASNGQRYYRNMEGQWTGQGAPPDANRVLELETTRAMLQPALAEQAQAIATIQQSPPSPQDVQREQTLYQYRIVGTELQPQWQEAIELATQRTREAEGLAGDGAMQLQRGPGGQYGADSPITHLQRGPDGVERIAAVTSTEDIRQALREVQARQHSAVPMQQVASAQRPSEGSADTDTSDASPPTSTRSMCRPAARRPMPRRNARSGSRRTDRRRNNIWRRYARTRCRSRHPMTIGHRPLRRCRRMRFRNSASKSRSSCSSCSSKSNTNNGRPSTRSRANNVSSRQRTTPGSKKPWIDKPSRLSYERRKHAAPRTPTSARKNAGRRKTPSIQSKPCSRTGRFYGTSRSRGRRPHRRSRPCPLLTTPSHAPSIRIPPGTASPSIPRSHRRNTCQPLALTSRSSGYRTDTPRKRLPTASSQ